MTEDLLLNREVQLDDILNGIAKSIQLDNSRRERMESAYKSVNRWLDEDEGFFKEHSSEVYIQGSVKIGTAIKPFNGDEFDLDSVLQVEISSSSITPEKLYNELKRRLNEHDTYRQKIELKNRCIRLNYAGDFHMDILPSCSPNRHNEEINIPDREKSIFLISNPKGYANWFLTKSQSYEYILLEKAYAHEDIPEEEPVEFKDPLKRSVQLVKWFRNEYFKDNLNQRPSSIVLTTLYAKYYNGETSIFNTLKSATHKILNEIEAFRPGKIQVTNPVNQEENFGDKWEEDENLYKHFVDFIKNFHETLISLENSGNRINEGEILKKAFGDTPVIEAYNSQSEFINQKRKNRSLNLDKKTGSIAAAVSSSTTPMKKNSFYGSE